MKNNTFVVFTRRVLSFLIFSASILLAPLVLGLEAKKAEYVEKTVVSGVEFENTVEIKGQMFEIMGAGLMRYMIIMRGYSAALYLGEGYKAEDLFDDIPKWLEIEYYHDIPASGFVKATRQGLEANLGKDELERMSAQIDLLYACYRDIEKHDRYSFVYLPGYGSDLLLNNDLLCSFNGQGFADAFFSIWLGENPLDERLKRDLFGQE